MLTAAAKSTLKTTIQTLEAALERALEAYSAALVEIESYSLDTGEGKQSAKYKDLAKLEGSIDYLESRIRAAYARLGGAGVVNVSVRRKHYNRTIR